MTLVCCLSYCSPPQDQCILLMGKSHAHGWAAGCSVVPTKHAHPAEWTPGSYVADGEYFASLSEQLPRTYLINKASPRADGMWSLVARYCRACSGVAVRG